MLTGSPLASLSVSTGGVDTFFLSIVRHGLNTHTVPYLLYTTTLIPFLTLTAFLYPLSQLFSSFLFYSSRLFLSLFFSLTNNTPPTNDVQVNHRTNIYDFHSAPTTIYNNNSGMSNQWNLSDRQKRICLFPMPRIPRLGPKARDAAIYISGALVCSVSISFLYFRFTDPGRHNLLLLTQPERQYPFLSPKRLPNPTNSLLFVSLKHQKQKRENSSRWDGGFLSMR